MVVKKFLIVSKKGNEILIDVEINDIEWWNDSIGSYEYGSQRKYDYQSDYIEDFEIGNIYIYLSNNKRKRIYHRKLLNCLSNYLHENDSFKETIEELAKMKIEDDKVDRLIDEFEYRKII